MKRTFILLFLIPLLQTSSFAQLKSTNSKQKASSLELTIRNELEKSLEKYRNEKSTETVWKQMRQEAEDILFTYFQKGKLLGVTRNQAYFIRIGPETMTSADIKNQKKILLAGIAIQKPAEFAMIRIEK